MFGGIFWGCKGKKTVIDLIIRLLHDSAVENTFVNFLFSVKN